MKDFTDKVAAITGAASGIGRALALDLARRRCHLENRRRVLIGRDARFLDRMQRLLPASYQRLVVSTLKRRRRKFVVPGS